jgi:D-alanine transaminase
MSDTAAIVYLNGQFLPLAQAFVPVLDRGFIFGDGVYEVIPVYGGRIFRLGEHLQRLDASLAGIRLTNPMTHAQWDALLTTLVAKNGGGELSLYLQITRGVAPRDHAFPANTAPTIFATTTALKPVAAELLASGARAITLEDIRWKHCHIKAIALLPNVLLRQQALDAGAQEAILIRDGLVTEGAASNIFMVKDGVIKTPPKGPFLLPGVTRDLALELAAANGLPHRECDFSREELLQADEAWLSSSTRELLPITQIDGQAIGSGAPGPVWQRLNQLYQAYKRALIAGEVE